VAIGAHGVVAGAMLTAMNHCKFCMIVDGALEVQSILETDDFMAFLDHRPVFKGHVLLIPREHTVTLPELPARLRDGFLEQAQRLSLAMLAIGAEGSFVALNNTVSQSVMHLHLHVVPRSADDGLRGFFWPRKKYENDEEAERYAEMIRAALG